MNAAIRQVIERAIAWRLIEDLNDAGYELRVDNGDSVSRWKQDKRATMRALFKTDDDRIEVRRAGEQGWIKLVQGNDGFDLISDYTMNLDKLIKRGAGKVADAIEAGRFNIEVK